MLNLLSWPYTFKIIVLWYLAQFVMELSWILYSVVQFHRHQAAVRMLPVAFQPNLQLWYVAYICACVRACVCACVRVCTYKLCNRCEMCLS